MKFSKFLFLAILFISTVLFTMPDTGQAQTITETTFRGGIFPFWNFPDIDSAVTKTSKYYDLSGFDAQTIHLTGYYDAGTGDSIQVIVLGEFNGSITAVPIDTVYLAADTWYKTTLTLSGYLPKFALKVVPWGMNTAGNANIGDVDDNGTFVCCLYSTVADYIPQKEYYRQR